MAKHLFKKGESGNPNGRPKDSLSITTEIKKKLPTIPRGQKRTYLELMVDRILHKAIIEGDEQMLKTVWAYIDGSPKQTTELTGKGGQGIIIQFTQQDEKL